MAEQATAEIIPIKSMLDPNRDERRDKSMVIMRVVNPKTVRLQLPAGNLIGMGVSYVQIYEDEVDAVKAMVEPRPDKLVQAKEAFDLNIAKEVAAAASWTGSVEELQVKIAAKNDPAINQHVEHVLATTPISIESEFNDLVGRSLLALTEAEVVKVGLAEPQRRGIEAEHEKFVEAIVTAVNTSNERLATTMAASIGEALGKALQNALGGNTNKK
jgi:hypothetical protein